MLAPDGQTRRAACGKVYCTVADGAPRLPSGGTAIVDRVTALRWHGRRRASEVGARPHSTGSPLRGGTGLPGLPCGGTVTTCRAAALRWHGAIQVPPGRSLSGTGFSFFTFTLVAARAAARLGSTLSRVPALRWHGCDVMLARPRLRRHALRVSASRRHGFLSFSPGRTHEVRHGYRLSPRPSPTLLGAVGVVAQGWTCSSLRVAHLERHGLALCTRAVVPDGPRLLPRAVASPVVPRGYAVWVEKTFEFPQHLSRLRARARVVGCQPTHGRGGFQRLEHALLAASAVSRPPGGAW